jgi:excisionase family DNA binding protein
MTPNTSHTLGAAAKATGVAKSTIYRAIKAGRISASRSETGDWSIDPAELHRVFPPVATGDAVAVERDATPDTGRLDAEITNLREMGALLRAQLEDTRRDRDTWRDQADAWRDQAQASQRLLTDARPPSAPSRRWWQRLAG